MLYFKAFLEGMAEMPAADPGIRAQIEAEAAERGWPQLHAELARVDPEAAARIHPNHSQRLARALEVYRASGKPLTAWHAEGRGGTPDPFEQYDIRQIAICPADRAVLHQRIALRFELMMKAGFLNEVESLYRRGDLNPDLPAIRAVGYRQLWQYLEREFSLDEAVDTAVAATRQLAKRQLTWLRKWPDLAWIITDSEGNLAENTLSEPSSSPRKRGSSGPGTRLEGKSPLDAALNYLGHTPM